MSKFNIYLNDVKVSTTDDTTFKFDNLQSNTKYKIGVSQVVDGQESEVATIKVRTGKEQEVELTVPEIKALLDERGIEYPSSARKAELIALLGE